MNAHTCHARGCDVRVPPRMFMCKPHWFALPTAMRHDILETYRPGQERTKDPSPEYLDAAMAAVEWLAGKTNEVAGKPANEPCQVCGHVCCDMRDEPLHDHFLKPEVCPPCARVWGKGAFK